MPHAGQRLAQFGQRLAHRRQRLLRKAGADADPESLVGQAELLDPRRDLLGSVHGRARSRRRRGRAFGALRRSRRGSPGPRRRGVVGPDRAISASTPTARAAGSAIRIGRRMDSALACASRTTRSHCTSLIMGNRQTVEPLTAAEFADAFPQSRKIYVEGSRGIRVPNQGDHAVGRRACTTRLRRERTSGDRSAPGPGGAAPRLGARTRCRRIGRHPRSGRSRARSDAPARAWSRHAVALRAQTRDHAGDGVHRDSRRFRA